MTNTTALYDEFMALAEKGDEQAARAFVLEHFKDLPQEAQDKVAFALYSEALQARVNEVGTVSTIQKVGGDALSALLRAKNGIENQAKISEHKDALNS